MKIALVSLFLFALSAPAFAQEVYCSDTQDSDYIITLDVENGQVASALFENQDWGEGADRQLSPGDYTYQGATLLYGGDTYACEVEAPLSK